MAGIEQKQYSTGDAWTAYLADANGWIDASGAYSVKLYGKVSGSPGTSIGPLTMTVKTIATFTANTASGSNQLSVVSAFTGITVGSTLTGSGIPTGAQVGSYDSVGGTILMVDATGNALNATHTATAVSIKANVGMATYTPLSTDVSATGVFSSEAAIHWDNTNTSVTIVPSKASTNPTITIDANITGAAE